MERVRVLGEALGDAPHYRVFVKSKGSAEYKVKF